MSRKLFTGRPFGLVDRQRAVAFLLHCPAVFLKSVRVEAATIIDGRSLAARDQVQWMLVA